MDRLSAIIATAALSLVLSACVSYPDEARELPEQGLLASDTFRVALSLEQMQSLLHERERFCRAEQDIQILDPTHGRYRKFTADALGNTREVLVIRLQQTESGVTEVTGYAADKRWLPYTRNFIEQFDNMRNCSVNI